MSQETRIGATTYATPGEREVVITRMFDAPRALVWEVWTSPAHVPNWMTGLEGWSMPVCEIDLRPGGAWRYVWRRGEDGTEMEMTGRYREIVPPHRIVNTESWGADWPETVNTLELAEAEGRTTITLTIVYPSKEARDAALQAMDDGLDRTFAQLDTLLQSMVTH